jgi:hypothetical protein
LLPKSGRACALAQGAADQLELTGADQVHVADRLSADIGRLDQRIGQLDERIPAVRGRRQQAGVGGPVGVAERGRESSVSDLQPVFWSLCSQRSSAA